MYTRIYSGKAKRCMCGCSGKYSEAGSRSFQILMKKLLSLPDRKDEDGVLWAEKDGRIYAAYAG